MRSIVRRDTGEGYEEFLTRLAKASGISTPTRDTTTIQQTLPESAEQLDAVAAVIDDAVACSARESPAYPRRARQTAPADAENC